MRESAPQLCSLPETLLERKGPASPPGQSCTGMLLPLGLDGPFPWACVHSAVQGILTNHGEFSSKALGIFIHLGNDAFTHAVFGKGSLLSSCLGLGRAGGRPAAAREPRQSRQLLLASPGVHAVRGKSRRLERVQRLRAAPAPVPAAWDPMGQGYLILGCPCGLQR